MNSIFADITGKRINSTSMSAAVTQRKGMALLDNRNTGPVQRKPVNNSDEPMQFTLKGGLIGGAVGALGALAVAATGGTALAAVAGMGLLGHYMTNSSEVNTPWRKNQAGSKDISVSLYYSPSLLGHFTLLMTENDKTTRIHFVLQEQPEHRLRRKAKQVTGFARGQVLINEDIDEETQRNYGGPARPLVSNWKIDKLHAIKMMNFLKEVNLSGSSYGYIVYSRNVDNCGSMVLKALAQAGISITLPRWKQWHQLPSGIKDDIH